MWLAPTTNAKKAGIRVFYYISPKFWAWRESRVKLVKKYVDRMYIIFPFEVDFYQKEKVNVEYVGHPLVERINQYEFLSKEEFFSKFALDRSKEILLVLPGSRKQEVKEIFPEIIKAADRLANNFNMQVVVARSKNIDEKYFQSVSGSNNFYLIEDFTYELMKYAKFGIIKSGTSTLEAGYFALPIVVVYKTKLLTYLIGKQLIMSRKC